tara:strand:+ start:360 stop:638 length:279 start_codon:yes stop_codon:yes gene_type:complete
MHGFSFAWLRPIRAEQPSSLELQNFDLRRFSSSSNHHHDHHDAAAVDTAVADAAAGIDQFGISTSHASACGIAKESFSRQASTMQRVHGGQW